MAVAAVAAAETLSSSIPITVTQKSAVMDTLAVTLGKAALEAQAIRAV